MYVSALKRLFIRLIVYQFNYVQVYPPLFSLLFGDVYRNRALNERSCLVQNFTIFLIILLNDLAPVGMFLTCTWFEHWLRHGLQLLGGGGVS